MAMSPSNFNNMSRQVRYSLSNGSDVSSITEYTNDKEANPERLEEWITKYTAATKKNSARKASNNRMASPPTVPCIGSFEDSTGSLPAALSPRPSSPSGFSYDYDNLSLANDSTVKAACSTDSRGTAEEEGTEQDVQSFATATSPPKKERRTDDEGSRYSGIARAYDELSLADSSSTASVSSKRSESSKKAIGKVRSIFAKKRFDDESPSSASADAADRRKKAAEPPSSNSTDVATRNKQRPKSMPGKSEDAPKKSATVTRAPRKSAFAKIRLVRSMSPSLEMVEEEDKVESCKKSHDKSEDGSEASTAASSCGSDSTRLVGGKSEGGSEASTAASETENGITPMALIPSPRSNLHTAESANANPADDGDEPAISETFKSDAASIYYSAIRRSGSDVSKFVSMLGKKTGGNAAGRKGKRTEKINLETLISEALAVATREELLSEELITATSSKREGAASQEPPARDPNSRRSIGSRGTSASSQGSNVTGVSSVTKASRLSPLERDNKRLKKQKKAYQTRIASLETKLSEIQEVALELASESKSKLRKLERVVETQRHEAARDTANEPEKTSSTRDEDQIATSASLADNAEREERNEKSESPYSDPPWSLSRLFSFTSPSPVPKDDGPGKDPETVAAAAGSATATDPPKRQGEQQLRTAFTSDHEEGVECSLWQRVRSL